jgi:hypothetical protein
LRATRSRGPAVDQPLVVLLDQQAAGEADQGGVVGLDADHEIDSMSRLRLRSEVAPVLDLLGATSGTRAALEEVSRSSRTEVATR